MLKEYNLLKEYMLAKGQVYNAKGIKVSLIQNNILDTEM